LYSGMGKNVNLVLSGGGIRGIAYAGMYEVAEKRGYNLVNIAGVSAGAIAGSIISAGYSASAFRKLYQGFDYVKIKVADIAKKVPAVSRFMEFSRQYRGPVEMAANYFFNQDLSRAGSEGIWHYRSDYTGYRGNFIKNLITFSKEGCLFDGDYLEDWVYRLLVQRGIRTFGDLKGGLADEVNPSGYKFRVLAVDATREKVIVLPDDSIYYGIKPENLEVAKAIRMSASVPFAFKPVELKKLEGNSYKVYNIIDGGVLDNFPLWLIGSENYLPTLGFRLDGGKKKLLSIDTPLQIFKFLISFVHDTGIPKYQSLKNKYVIKINTGKVSSLDMDLSQEEMDYLYNEGRYAALILFNNIESRFALNRRRAYYFFANRWR
jgi:NTE family protein